jgi:hypothetical protein
MNPIQKLHLELIKSPTAFTDSELKNELLASKSSEITEQIAIEFADWLYEVKTSIAYSDIDCPRLYKKSTEELYQEFLKTK